MQGSSGKDGEKERMRDERRAARGGMKSVFRFHPCAFILSSTFSIVVG